MEVLSCVAFLTSVTNIPWLQHKVLCSVNAQDKTKWSGLEITYKAPECSDILSDLCQKSVAVCSDSLVGFLCENLFSSLSAVSACIVLHRDTLSEGQREADVT